MFEHLLVPLDGSELAEAALPLATAVAEKFHSKITLVTAGQVPYYVGEGLDFTKIHNDISQNIEEETKQYLRQKQKDLIAQGFQVNLEIVVGHPPADTILQTAATHDVDTIVMSTHGRGGVLRWMLGSVADMVLRKATVPVLLARVSPRHAAKASEAVLANS